MVSQQKTLVKAQPRAIAQVFFTLFQVGTAFASFYFAMRVKHYTDLLNDNFEDQPTTQFLPCIRNTIQSQCDPATEPNCWDRCCPSGYSCDRSPVVGLHCFDLSNPCGDPEWCEFYADISKQCRNDVCQLDKMVERMVVWAFILSGIGVLFDIIDMVMFFAAQDAVTVKAVNNLASCCVKCLAFSVIFGASGLSFFTALKEAKCYNAQGTNMVSSAQEILTVYLIFQILSAVMSLCLAPVSAYYGGKLHGIPYVK